MAVLHRLPRFQSNVRQLSQFPLKKSRLTRKIQSAFSQADRQMRPKNPLFPPHSTLNPESESHILDKRRGNNLPPGLSIERMERKQDSCLFLFLPIVL